MTIPGSHNGQENEESVATRHAHIENVMTKLVKNSTIYGVFMATASLTRATRGSVVTRMQLEQSHVNSKGSLHGAVSATIIDFTTGLAIASWDLRETTGASVDMHITYLSTAKVGDVLEIESTAERVGGSMAFVTIRISKVGEDGSSTLVTLGQHTKYVKGTAPAIPA